MSLMPTAAQLREAHADPNITEAAEIVQELTRQGLTLTEVCRLCSLPGRTITIRALQEGGLRTMKPDVLEALKLGYQRFDAGYTGYRVRRSTRPAEIGVQKPDAVPQPRLLDPRSRLVERLREKRKAAA